MKYTILLCITLFVCSCCGTKKVIESQPKTSEEIVQVVTPSIPEIPEVPEPSKELEVETEVAEEIEVEIEETPIIPQPEDIVENIEIAEAFNHSSFNDLLQNHVSSSGNVNNNGFKANRTALGNYISDLGDNMQKNAWSKNDKLAYWINAYNAMTIDLILRNPKVKSIKDIDKPWDQRLWKLGEKWYNLDEIEHQILRKMDEPRIHFAIVCASVSCPKLQNEAFTASNLDSQLTNATKEFLSDSSRNNLSKSSVKLSKIFKWFAKDFKQNQSLIDFLNKYSDIDISQNATKSYMNYNWDLND